MLGMWHARTPRTHRWRPARRLTQTGKLPSGVRVAIRIANGLRIHRHRGIGTDRNRAPRASNPGLEGPALTVHTVPDHHRTRPRRVRNRQAGQRGAWPVYRPCPMGLSSFGQGLPRD